MKPIGRNSISITIAVLAALVAIGAPCAAIVAIWQWDLKWLLTAVALLVLAWVLYFISTQVWDSEPEPQAARR